MVPLAALCHPLPTAPAAGKARVIASAAGSESHLGQYVLNLCSHSLPCSLLDDTALRFVYPSSPSGSSCYCRFLAARDTSEY